MNKKDFGTPPVEVSENLRSLEIDKRTLRKTHRVHQFNTSVSEKWLAKLRAVAYEDRLKYVEVLEKALECYEKQRKKENQHQQPKDKKQESKISPQIKQKEIKKPLNQFWKVNFICDKCYRRFEKSIVYSLSPDLDELNQYPTYCADCGEIAKEELRKKEKRK
ncbi:MAG: hypothetical protein MRECE_43c011 [Mycoplasmataceae bacterium CE_OT135]|nr:MAG: hypothetical protein MRECE_43c011 [Mycoplasmataceae bacterium CE_OT135]